MSTVHDRNSGRRHGRLALPRCALLSGLMLSPSLVLSDGGPSPARPGSGSQGVIPGMQAADAGAGDLLLSDPQAFLRRCLEQGAARFSDYRCVFIKNERLGRKLTGEQAIDVLYRHTPRSVYMKWTRNPGGARRVLWVQGRDRDSAGREQVRVEPTGVAAVFVKNVLVRMDDRRVRQESRRPITEFGFCATLEYILRDNETAARAGVLDLRYEGTGTFDGRATYVLVRRLPYDPRQPTYPDARMVLHIDQEWLVPLSIHCYAEQDERTLLESYKITRVQQNLDLSEQDFRF